MDGAPRERSERPRWPKLAPRALRRAQYELQDDSRHPKMSQGGAKHAPMPQEAKELAKDVHDAPK
eukprot:5787000-Pyramimonas_sp.AAC.1